ncbi:CRP-like cAMP-binding protein [Pedobacter cryoconitis]|uniref:CRP-like cAMP-binding protein n=2 Tax=Pedobacter cryoconitis TaxID=188932 RepID=A0A7W8YXM9_9SPHI|nr:CRP-like cAMP-binding protein [Pedobacter cryoconitis]
MQNSILSEIFKGVNFSAAEEEIVFNKFKKILISKGDILLSAGQSVSYQYYVRSGCLRTFFLDEAGKEYTVQFAVNDWWISDYTAFFTGEKSMLYIECIQEAEIFQISRESMEKLYHEVPAIETFYRKKMERFFSSFQKRILSDLALPAKEKYLRFVKTYPQIEQSIKNYHLASYLGITTESLSRIRKELAHQ